jgi:hypothetical protein
MPPEAGVNLMQSLLSVFVEPDLARRLQAGRPLAPGTPLVAIQVVFNVRRDAEVRLNDEVRGVAHARARRDMVAGEEVMSDDIAELSRIELTDEDPDAAHITALLLGDGWHISWDGRYNASLIAAHLRAAKEFASLAEVAVENGQLRGFAENAYAAAELCSKAELLSLPDEQLLAAKTHGAVASRFNRWAHVAHADRRYATLLNELERLRGAARYLNADFRLTPDRARELLATLKELRSHVDAVSPPPPRTADSLAQRLA